MTKRSLIDLSLFWKIWLQILEENKNGAVIIVEGRKDYKALRKLRVTGRVMMLNTIGYGKLLDYLEEKRINKAIILTDFDSEGELEAFKLNKLLKRTGITVLESLRINLKKSLFISKIEELSDLVELLYDGAPLNIYLDDLKEIYLES